MMPELQRTVPRWPSVGGGRRVIVIGGGPSGLCAAWSLREAGFAPVVLERTARVGGRFFTLRGHFGEQYAELGATRIADTHALTLAYIRHFGLPLVEYPFEGARQLYSLLGRRFRSSSRGSAEYPEDLPLRPEERRLDAESLEQLYTAQISARIGDPRHAEWPSTDALRALADQTFSRSLDGTAASVAVKEICRAYNGTEIDMFDALSWVGMRRLDAAWQRTFAIEGGNDRLTSAFAASLGDVVVTSAEVRSVRCSEDRVSVGYVRGGQEEVIDGDFVVCAVPHRILLDVAFDPPLSEGKRRAAGDIKMLSVTRLNFQFSRRFWNLDEGLRGLLVACTTSPIERLWDLTATQEGQHGILAAYVHDHHAEFLDRLPSDEARVAYGLDVMESFFPGARRHFVRGLSFSWHHQPWARGGWAAFQPGQTRQIAELHRAEGRVHFAGDHTGLYSGWAQGAFESAHFAVAEIVSACRGASGGAGRGRAHRPARPPRLDAAVHGHTADHRLGGIE